LEFLKDFPPTFQYWLKRFKRLYLEEDSAMAEVLE
jgi:hypothetical protein